LYIIISVHRHHCKLLLQMSHVMWSTSLCMCCSWSWAVQKWLN